jgi:hypothetical protein
MNGKLIALLAWLGLLWGATPAPAADEVCEDEKGTYLGALFCPAKSGALITRVLPNSPAAAADLRADDVVLRYADTPVRDSDHLARLIRADKPDRKVQLLVRRGQAQKAIDVTLALGPALKLAAAKSGKNTTEQGRPGVTVYAAPLDAGKMRLTIEYWTAGKLETVTCEGVAAEVATTVGKLPDRERDLVRIALRRLKAVNSEKEKRASK